MHEIKMPQMGQSVEEASIVQWLKKEGDAVAKGEPIASIQTDKAEIEFESPVEGILRKILVDTDVLVPVLTPIALVGDADERLPDTVSSGAEPSATPEASGQPEQKYEAPAALPAETVPAPPAASVKVSPRARAKAASLGVDPAAISGTGAGGRVMDADVVAHAQTAQSVRATPTARRVAEAQGVELSQVEGTGPRGKIMKADVLARSAAEAAKPAPEAAAPSVPSAPGEVRRVALSPMRRIIAQRMAESKFSAPHYYVTVEVDMAAAVAFRSALAYKPSYNDLVLRAVVRAIQKWPQVNARWAGDAIEEVADINLGFAVALPKGLVVPVVKRAQDKSLQDIHRECRELTDKARNGKLLPDDYAGNTFTVSNLGGFGVDHFTAIINQPDSAILAVGQIKDRVVVIDGGIHIRPIMKMTLSSDHRTIDGALAAQFMGTLKEILEAADF
jgi:pyruvate dehydrogenase E2 component (dihydrolipoamide acetyltransferase)